MKTKTLKLISKIFINVFCVIFGIVVTVSSIANANPSMVNSFLGIKTQEIITKDDDGDTLYYKTDYESISSLKQNGEKICREVAEEGIVLLKNQDNALPLESGTKLSLFSSSSCNFIFAGGGSSYSKGASTITLKEGLEQAGFVVNSGLWEWYSSNKSYWGMHSSSTSTGKAGYKINDASWSVLPSAKIEKAEAAIFVLSRYGTEATDVPIDRDKSDMTNGNYLELSPTEIDVLNNLKTQKDAGVFKKIIILMNSAVPVQCDFVDSESYGIDALLWVGEPGSTGTLAIGNVLCGKVNPSGRTVDTFFTKHLYNPVYANWGNYSFEGTLSSASNSYVVYQEGIYNGYRYTETRYEDSVLGADNVGDFDYDRVVAYPFGYGLSYTTFEYSDFSVKYDASSDVFKVSVDVKNTGSVAGKEVVQIYLQKPYTEYDKTYGIEKASVELVGYAKTDMLQPNATQTCTIEVKGSALASYDAYCAKTYIVETGAYYFAAAQNAHEAINNILARKAADGTQLALAVEGNVDLVYKTEKNCGVNGVDSETYSKSDYTDKTIINKLDNADLNLYDGAGNNSVEYVSRSDWQKTVKLGYSETYEKLNNSVKISVTEKMQQDSEKASPTRDDKEYPTYGAENGLSLIMLRAFEDGKPIAYDDPLWDKLLDELTWDETVMLLSNALRSTSAIGGTINKPTTMDGNGAVGPVNSYDANSSVAIFRYSMMYGDPDSNSFPTQYPCNSLVGATFNDELSEELGKAIGEDCLWAGYAGLYGPGCNLHRGAYNGRAFEYYSEDPILSGYICAAETRGIQSKGVYVYLKHAVLNEAETNRHGVSTFVNEQTIRELYLKPFEIAIGEGGAFNVMTGFNRIGVVWTGQQGFINTILRDEFGMRGFAVSDFWKSSYMTLAGGIMNGNDLPDGDTASNVAESELNAYKEGYGEFAWQMRESAHRILYTVVQSSGMNGISSNTIVRLITPWWQPTLKAVSITSGVILFASLACYVALEIKERIEKGKTSNA